MAIWMRDTISSHLTDFNMATMWNQEVLNTVLKYLYSPEESLFLWIDASSARPALIIDNTLRKETRKNVPITEDTFLYFIKYTGKDVKITEDNVYDNLAYGILSTGDNMKSLLSEINYSTLPKFLRDKEWPENIKKDLLEQTHKFMAHLTEVVSDRYNTTELYIPQDNLDENLTGTEEKDRNHRLKEVLSHWTKQIRELINNQSNQSESDNAGPLEEINNWTKRRDNLINIKIQLEKPELKKIQSILKSADPKNLKTFEELVRSITGGAEEAEDNLKYLQSLQAPCTELTNSSPLEIIDILPRVLNCVRLIKEYSQFYKSDEKISGLLRKISNEIINRCKKCINLDDMLKGDVNKCIADLKDAISCGEGWKNIYNDTVRAIKAAGVEWKIKPDSIFAQIEAFVQRCNDLIEICEGQIQFARKGRKIDIPRFSGSKGPEIVAVLDEIKSTFGKYLENIKGSEKDKILDINSTKWHDDYSNFKAGTKNLEIMYMNLINFAFEHVNKLPQAVEYMEAFDDLAQKATIKSHVHKQIGKINEIFKRELTIADQASKKPFSLPYNHGKNSGQAIWIRSLLYRIEKLKSQYNRLNFIQNTEKKDMTDRYDQVERNLTAAMRDLFIKFRYRKDQDHYEETIHNWENNKILAITEEVLAKSHTIENKNNPVIAEARAEGKHHIEANFNKEMHKLLIEVPAFKKLLKDNIGNFGPKTEEFVEVKKDMLKVAREIVMTAVRDYNMIRDLMDPKEKLLFEQHLAKLDEHKIKGKNHIRWTHVVDQFIRKMLKTCSEVYVALMKFKKAKAHVEEKISEISKMNKFIDYDSKEAVEIDVFYARQNHNQDMISQRISNTFSEIKKTLAEVFEQFVDKRQSIHVAWFDYIRSVDIKIEDELKKAVKNSLQGFSKAIKGDEKTKTNPAHLLKIYIILKSTKDDFELTFDPKGQEVIDKIFNILNKSLDVLLRFKHIESDMLDIRSRRVQELKEAQEEERKLGAHDDNRKEYNPDNSFLTAKFPPRPTFKEIANDVATSIVTDIRSTLEKQLQHLSDYITPWKKDQFKLVWTKAKKDYFQEMLSKELKASNYKEQIYQFETAQNKIKTEQPQGEILCIQVDTNKIRTDMGALCTDGLKKLLIDIKQITVSKLDELYGKFKAVKKELEDEPDDLVKLKDAQNKLAAFTNERSQIETIIPELEEVFKLLDDHMEYLEPNDNLRRNQLPEKSEEFKKNLQKMNSRNQDRYAQLQKNFQDKVAQIQTDIIENKQNFDKTAPKGQDDNSVEGAYKKLDLFLDQIETFKQRIQEMDFGFKLFKITYIPVPELAQVEEGIVKCRQVWDKKKEWMTAWNKLKEIKFRDIDTSEIKETCEKFLDDLKQFEKQFREWPVTKDLKAEIQKIIDNMPIIDILRQECIRDRHWDETKKLVSVTEEFQHNGDFFTLEKFMKYNFIGVVDKINDIYERAQAQFKVETTLNEIIKAWEELKIDMAAMPNASDIFLIKRDSVNKINERLDKDMVTLASLKTNLSAQDFEKTIEKWDQDLNIVLESTEILYTVQKKFEYVNNIFVNLKSESGQMPGDLSNFGKIKSTFKTCMDRIHLNPIAKQSLTMDGFSENLTGIGRDIDRIQAALRDLLRKRRGLFPRLYFLSDEDMFEMLGNAKNPAIFNKHIKKMYEGIKKLETFEERLDKTNKIVRFKQMESPDGEVIPFEEPVDISGNLIEMLSGIEKQMKDSLKVRLKAALPQLESITNLKQQSSIYEQFIRETPGQIILLCLQIEWTKRCEEEALRKISDALMRADKPDKDPREANKKRGNPIKEEWTALESKYNENINELANLMLNPENSPVMKLKITAMIIVLVHCKDIISELLAKNCSSPSTFEWAKQLRFRKIDEGTLETFNILIVQANARFFHGWEYQGNNGRLIVTPLTDKCYLTLTTAMHLKRGGSPQGPAGTGKTETVKDLGKNMGRFVFVFNCSEGLDVKSLKNMFEGFALTGSWSCFDEFNRIEIEVLSVVAIYIKSILDSLALISIGETGRVNLDDTQINLNVNCSLFITMNPGYSGRTALPDNLKALFRPISMMVPDSQLICQITLQSEGFQTAVELAKKISSLYVLMARQLSQQDHYDFGLRAIKAVLNAAGRLKRKDIVKVPTKGKSKASEPQNSEQEKIDESLHLIKAIRSMNDPKLVAEDEPLFKALLNDLFPKFKIESKKDRELSMEIHKMMIGKNMGNSDYAVSKVIQLFDSKRERHGNMLVGKTMSGKTTTIQVLAEAMNSLHEKGAKGYDKVSTYVLNPKSISMTELYGYYDSTEDKSHIGVFSYMMKMFCNESNTPDQKWIIFDGPIDTKWIESMNSLLDDNKLLTLLDGDRINLHPLVSLVFETETLEQASPATVSRCGMIYMDTKMLDWDNLRLRWLLIKEKSGYDEESLDQIDDLFDKWVTPILEAKRLGKLVDVIPLQENHVTLNLLALLDCYCTKENGLNYENRHTDEMFWIKYEKWFTYCVIWSLGATLHEDSRKLFDTMIRGIEDVFPLSQTVYDSYINSEKSEFVKWEEKLSIQPQNWKPKEANIPSHKLIVETVDTIRTKTLIEIDHKNGIPILLVGATGTGKTSITNNFLGELPESEYTYNIINLSAQTTSSKLQSIIESKLNTSTKKRYRPHSGKRGVLFIDDLNMPKRDEFGSQPPLELMRQLIEYRGWYDRNNLDNFVDIEKIDIICAMAPPSGGRNQISNRLSSKFHLINLTLPNTLQTKRIYTSILNYKTQGFELEEVRAHIDKVVEVLIDCFSAVTSEEQFKPTPQKSHYLFNLRDMSRVIQGMTMVDKDSCDSQDTFLKLMFHEHLRVYRDRMTNSADRNHFRKIFDSLLVTHFGKNIATLLNEPQDDADYTEDLIFVDFIDPNATYYAEVKDKKELKTITEAKLAEFNRGSKRPIDVVFFDDALKYLCRIYRIIKMSSGHALLIGEGGSGRHSLSRMASYLAGYKEFQIKITKNYSSKHFQAEIQNLFKSIVIQKQASTFIFSDNEITSEGIIEDVNNILNLGEIPNLFQKREGKDDFQEIRDKLKDKTKKETDEKIYENFINEVQRSLHICFCMSQSGSNLRTLARKYPGLINNTTQIWFDDWPFEALFQVATHYLKDHIEVEIPPKEAKEGEEGEEEEYYESSEEKEDEDQEARDKRKLERKIQKENEIREELKKDKLKLMGDYFAKVHCQIKAESQKMYEELRRVYYVTPKIFIDFVKEFITLREKKKEEISNQLNTYSIGLERLAQANEDAIRIRNDITLFNEEQKIMKKKLDDVLKKSIEREKQVKKSKETVEAETKAVEEEERNANELQDKCNEQLALTQPILDEADEKVKELEGKKGDFAEVKALALKGHQQVLMVMKAMMVLMGKPTSIEAINEALTKDFVGKMKLIDKVKLATDRERFDKFEDVAKHIPPDLKKTSMALDTVRGYVSSLATYVKAVKEVIPVQEEIEGLKKKIKELRERLDKNKFILQEAEAKERELQKQKNEYTQELKTVEEQLIVLEARNERAEDLVKGLESSKESWTISLKKLTIELKKVEGDTMLSVAFMGYFGPFSSEYRERLNKILFEEVHKSKVECSPDWEFVNYIGDDMQVLNWTFQGLPSDQFSKENGVIVMNTGRWPLLIDPQNQGSTWIKNLLRDNCEITNPMDPKLINIITLSIQNGWIVLFENIDEDIDPALEPVLNRQIKNIDGKEAMVFGENDIAYNRNFRFYMTTRHNNPVYKAEISTKVSIVNFTVKEKGLEEQLLEELIKIMNKQLEDTRVQSIQNKARDEKELKLTEEKILKKLFDSNDKMVDDIDLINTLKKSVETEATIMQSIAMAKTNLEKNKIARDNYRPIGYIGSILYFTIYNLNKIDPMYQFSLDSYVNLFKKVVTEKKEDRGFGAASEVIKEKIEAIDAGLREAVYKYACRGIFEKDKLLLSLQICVNLAEYDEKQKKEKGDEEEKKPKRGAKRRKKEEKDDDGENKEEVKEADYYKEHFKAEWSFFLKGGIVVNKENQMANPDTSWILPAMWDNITEMESLYNFQGIAGSFTHTNKDWKRFFTSEQPEIEPLPSDWGIKIKGFSLLVLLRAIRPDRIPFAVSNFIKAQLGEKFIHPPPFDIQEIYETLNKNTPCLFILSPGADPLSYIENLALEKRIVITQVSLGQKQTARALEKIKNGRLTGQWVYLANVHLSSEFLKDLESIIEDIMNNRLDGKTAKSGQLSENFRLFMTANPSKNMPVSILQKCMKITTEPPKGIKNNMLKLYNNLVKDTFEEKDCQDVEKYSKLLFALSWFHSLVIERKKFRTLGWNVMYDFNDSDFMFSDKLIRGMVDIPMPKSSNSSVQWDAIRSIIAEINYGGRVTDDYDKRLLKQYANELFVEDLFSKEKQFILSNYKADTEYKVPKEIIDSSVLKTKITEIPVMPTKDSPGSPIKDMPGPPVKESNMNKICVDYITPTFPNVEIPGIFGSHGNAEVTSLKMEASILLDSLLSLQPRDTGSSGKSREEAIIALIEERSKSLPAEIDYNEAKRKNFKYGEDNPLVNVMLQEITRYNKLLEVVQKTFVDLVAGLRGQTLISEEMEIILQNIFDNKVPNRWKFAYLSIKPLISWLDDLTRRFEQMRQWAFGPPMVSFWLGGFAYPTGFTTALQQKYCRANKLEIDNLKWDFGIVKTEATQPPRDGAYLNDIFLEGARWAINSDFIDDEISMILLSKLPTIHMRPVDKNAKVKAGRVYHAPVYYYPIREGTRENPSFIFEMTLPMNPELDEPFFIKRGTACLLNSGE